MGYDNCDQLLEDDAVDIIASTACLSSFQETVESRAELADLALILRTGIILTFEPPPQPSPAGGGSIRVGQVMSSIDGINDYVIQFESYF
jgi:hypothetical protein